ncbi:hypothetical protein HK103_004571 [Boothiomyces macroporosus]|uniref:Bromo domain-containing protein n=1 Tax=Boothiomyces macroporosus TaxID=261099 RepID=A0AAD5UGA9_9FUNG|nr:hypothetical protein HK103_004571 [Boothiomyces macroporosus]
MSTKKVPKISLTVGKRRLSQEVQKPLKKLKITSKGIKVIFPLTQIAEEWQLDSSLVKETATKLLEYLLDYKDGYIIAHQSKLEKGGYKQIDEFKGDVLQCFANCKSYNQPGSDIYKDATELEGVFTNKYLELRGVGPAKSESPASTSPVNTPSKRKGRKSSEKKSNALEQLFEAIENDDIDTFIGLLDNEHVNKLHKSNEFDTEYTWSLLHAACYYGHEDFVEILMETGADVELEDTWYHGRALAWAAFGNHAKLCKILIEKYNADKDAKNEHGQVAFDLVADPGAKQWRGIFDKKPEKKIDPRKVPETPTSITIKVPPQANQYGSQQRIPQFQTPTTFGNKFYPQSAPAQLRKQYPTRKVEVRAGVKPVPGAPFTPQAQPALSAYAMYNAQKRDPIQQTPLLESIDFESQDGSFSLTLPFNKNYIEEKVEGHCITLTNSIKSISLKLKLNPAPFGNDAVKYLVTGHHSTTFHTIAGSQTRSDQLNVVAEDDIHVVNVLLADFMNIVEFCVSAIGYGVDDAVETAHQTFMIAINRN